jgi:hypothetical protein
MAASTTSVPELVMQERASLGNGGIACGLQDRLCEDGAGVFVLPAEAQPLDHDLRSLRSHLRPKQGSDPEIAGQVCGVEGHAIVGGAVR